MWGGCYVIPDTDLAGLLLHPLRGRRDKYGLNWLIQKGGIQPWLWNYVTVRSSEMCCQLTAKEIILLVDPLTCIYILAEAGDQPGHNHSLVTSSWTHITGNPSPVVTYRVLFPASADEMEFGEWCSMSSQGTSPSLYIVASTSWDSTFDICCRCCIYLAFVCECRALYVQRVCFYPM